MSDDPQKITVSRELASKEADRRWNEAVDRLKYATEYAQAGLKGLFLANGGAIVALLTFVGNAKPTTLNPVGLWWSFCWFSLGLVAVLATYVIGYVSQASSMQACLNLAWQADSFAHGTGRVFEIERHAILANRAENFGIGLVIGSLVLFVVGAFVALDAIT